VEELYEAELCCLPHCRYAKGFGPNIDSRVYLDPTAYLSGTSTANDAVERLAIDRIAARGAAHDGSRTAPTKS
jgi:hypothetical protein